MMDNPLKGSNKIIVKAILKAKIVFHPTALMYSVHTVKSKITSNQLPTISTTPILDNMYPDNQFYSFDITKAIIDSNFCGIMIKATAETTEATGCAQLGGSKYIESPILEIHYYEKDNVVKDENSKHYSLNEKGTLSVNLMQSAKHFYHSDLKIGPLDFQHVYFDEYIQYGKNKENKQITPNYHMGTAFKNNLQRYLYLPHRKDETIKDNEIYSVEINNQVIPFKKKYIYDDGNIHFIKESQVEQKRNGKLCYTVNNKTYDVEIAYYDQQGRVIQLNEEYYKLVDQLGKQRSLKKYFMDIHNNKIPIVENGDETFDIEIAYLEGREGYYVDKEYISENESGDMVYIQNGFNLEVVGYGTKKRRIHKNGYEESYLTSFLQYNQIGQIEAGYSKRIIQREQDYDEALSNQMFEEETIAIDNVIQQLYSRKEELIIKYQEYKNYREDHTLSSLEEQYQKLQNSNTKMQLEYSEYQLQKERESILKDEERKKFEYNLKKNLSTLLKINKNEIINPIDKKNNTAMQDIKKRLSLNDNNQKIIDNQKEMQYLQVLIEERNEQIKKEQIQIYLTQMQNSIDNVTQQIQELEEQLQEYIQIEKAKPIDFMMENNCLLGFDFEGKMVQITQGNQSVKIVYENDNIKQVQNKDGEILLELTYQDGMIHHIKDYYGRNIDYIYESGFLKKVVFSDETLVQYNYNDFGLYTIQDAYGNMLEIMTSLDHQEIKKYSNIQSISHQNVEKKTNELLEKEIVYFGREEAIVTNEKESFVYLFDDFGNIVSSYEKDNQNNTKNAINHFENENCAYTFYLDETTKNELKNGDFEQGSLNWMVEGSVSSISNPTISGSKSLKLNESAGVRKIKQSLSRLELNTNEVHAFMFSGWAKANNSLYVNKKQRKLEEEEEINAVSTAKFELRAEILYEDGSKEMIASTFDWTNQNWQLCSLPVLIDKNKNVQNITFIADYSFNTGDVIFDNFRLCKANGKFIQYNEDKTIQYVTDFKTKTNYLQYEQKKPTKMEEIDENGNCKIITYLYGPNQELRKIETSDGLINEFLMDEENKKRVTMVYHKDDPTTRYYYHQQFDEFGRVISELEKEDDQAIHYTYYDDIHSLLKTQTMGNQTIYYGYHPINEKCISQSQSVNHIDYSFIYGYTNNLLTQVKSNEGTTVNYEYDGRGNLTKVNINDKEIVQISTTEEEITYYQEGSRITEKGTIQIIYYFNEEDLSVKKIYNKDGKLIKTGYIQKGCDLPVLSCEYNKKGQLINAEDEKTLKEIHYQYDEDGRLSSVENDALKTTFTYNANNLISQKTDLFDNAHTYTYHRDYNHFTNPYLCTKYAYQDFIIHYDYDLLQRIKQKKTIFNNVVLLQEKYGHLKEGDQTFDKINRVQVAHLNKTKDDYQYIFDSNNNITDIYENGRLINHYQYDEANRLIEEQDFIFNQRNTYFYDSNGNILNKITYNLKTKEFIKENKYRYASNGISDMLVNFNDESCSYDEHGNITNYRNQICKFDKFHKLEQIGENSFTYDAFGCRTRKNKIYYIYDGQGNLCKEEGEHEIFYHYEGDKVHSIHVDGNDYLLRRNLFGDVTHIYDTSGELCAMYRYDAWGNHKVYDELGNENNAIDFIGNINPIRYRGYYFDKETALFYCNYRYYDPEVGRWISSDSIDYLNLESINGLNLYAYCGNDPVNKYDPTGHSAILVMVLIGTLFGAAVGFGFDAGKQLINNGWDFSEVDWGSAVNSGIVGGALGFSLTMGIGYLGPVIAGTATAGGLTAGGAFAISTTVSFGAGALGYATEEWMNGRTPSFGKAMMHGGFVALEGMVNFGVGGIVGSLGNVGTKGKFVVSKEWWGKFIFGLEFTQPFKIGIDYIRKNI